MRGLDRQTSGGTGADGGARAARQGRQSGPPAARRGLTLVELLCVAGVIVLLAALVLPAFSKARHQARDVLCKSHLKSLGAGLAAYSAAHDDTIIPSYNMRGITGSRLNPFDGWAPILDRDDFVAGNATLVDNPFVCPETANRSGLAVTNRGASDDDPLGYMDWPAVLTFTAAFAVTIPERGFEKIIRTSYWINGENPVGAPREVRPGLYYTASVGYGPDGRGRFLPHNSLHQIATPGRLVALADGIYAGNQAATRPGQKGLRIGYRHGARLGHANVAFADGHVDSVRADAFPRAPGPGVSLDQARAENLATGPTLYARPDHVLVR